MLSSSLSLQLQGDRRNDILLCVKKKNYFVTGEKRDKKTDFKARRYPYLLKIVRFKIEPTHTKCCPLFSLQNFAHTLSERILVSKSIFFISFPKF